MGLLSTATTEAARRTTEATFKAILGSISRRTLATGTYGDEETWAVTSANISGRANRLTGDEVPEPYRTGSFLVFALALKYDADVRVGDRFVFADSGLTSEVVRVDTVDAVARIARRVTVVAEGIAAAATSDRTAILGDVPVGL